MIDATKSWNYSRHANTALKIYERRKNLHRILYIIWQIVSHKEVKKRQVYFRVSFAERKLVLTFVYLSNTIWHFEIIYLPMNKIFQLCFMFSQEIYIKLETLPSRNTEFLPVIFCFLEYFHFVFLCVKWWFVWKWDRRFCENNNWLVVSMKIIIAQSTNPN